MSPWQRVKHLFECDDSALPDIYVENLSSDEIVIVYEWIMSQCTVLGESVLWSLEEKRDILVRDFPHPARAYVQRKVESFRHCLAGLFVGGVELPTLSICMEVGGVSFDYRAGPEWSEREVVALFELLRQLSLLVPNARITQTDEGCYLQPNPEFSEALQEYSRNKSTD